MGGISFRHGTLVVERDPNELDRLAISFSSILGDLDIDHVFVSGYVAILAGRARATEDIDVLLERVGEDLLEELVVRLEGAAMWGPATPLEDLASGLDDRVWIARQDEMVPHIDATFVADEFDRASLDNRITAELTPVDAELPIGPLELQIAYKLFLGAQRDIEDAHHLYWLFEENLNRVELERWVRRLDVPDEYERLERA